MGLNYTRGSTIIKTTTTKNNNDHHRREVPRDFDEETETRIRGESRHPTNVLHVSNISPRLTGHHVREIFNAYQLNEKNEHRGIENVSFGHGRKFCRVQFRELEDAEYARENLDGGEIDGREIKVAFVDSVSCVEKGGVGGGAAEEERRGFGGFGGYENNRNNTFDNNNGRGDSGTFRGRRRDFGGGVYTTYNNAINGTCAAR